MRLVEEISPLGGGRFLVRAEGGEAFPLYRSELLHYGLEEGGELGEEEYREIMDKTLPAIRISIALRLLERMDRTEAQLRRKLSELRYPEEIVEEAIAYVKSFHYLDDARYARQYIESRRETESLRQMRSALAQRGIGRSLLEEILQETEPPREEEQISRWLAKRQFHPDEADEKERERMYRFLLRKGYSWEAVRRAVGGE